MKRPIYTLAAVASFALGLAATSCGDPAPRPSSTDYYGGERRLSRFTHASQQAEVAAFDAAALVRLGKPEEADSTRSFRRTESGASLLIRTGQVTLEVDSLEPAVAAVHALAVRLGGYVGGTATRMGRGDVRSANIQLKVPADRFDEALAGVRPVGDVEFVDITTADVTEEFVDVTARTENARRLERRLAQILASRTGALKDVLEVEQALARVREEIERHQGRLRYLSAHAAMSNLAVNLHEPAAFVGRAGGSRLGEALEQAWANFVSLAVVFVQALGFVVPLALLAAGAWLGVRKFGHAATSAS